MIEMKKMKKVFLLILTTFTAMVFLLSSNIYAVEVVISGNAEDSVNTVDVNMDNTIQVEQSNEATIVNDIQTDATTGGNSISDSMGNEANIDTGDIKQETVITNSQNSQMVDIDCCQDATDIKISGNSADTQNSVSIEMGVNTNIVSDNKADILNSIVGSANTGNNIISSSLANVGIATGNIYITGGIDNGPVNTYSINGSSGIGGMSVSLIGNSSGSKNTVSMSTFVSTNIAMSSLYDAKNIALWDLNTGNNNVNGAMGSVSIETGDIFFDFFIKNGPINIGGISWDCCESSDYDPGENDDNDDPYDPGTGGDGNIPPSNESSSSGSSSTSTDSGAGGVSAILGLSDTSSTQAQALLFMVGLLFIASGLGIIGKEIFVS